MRRFIGSILLGVLGLAACLSAAEAPDENDMRLLRMPDIHGDQIVFVYAGDIWTVPTGGGEARRLTSHGGSELFPKFSPDGQAIAFSGEYDGNLDVYVIRSVGGEPLRLTYHPGWDRVIDWQPDGRAVRFQSPRASRSGRDLQLWTVPAAGGLPTQMILPTGGLSSYSPDAKRLAYNRNSRENRTWKRYKGGWAQDIWIYDFERNDTQKATDWIGTDSFPMWYGDTIYYLSDETAKLQIWAYDTRNGERRQVTDHKEYDCKYPSLGDGAIVYENGGWLYVLDLTSGKSRKVTVSLHDDRILARPVIKKVDDNITGADIAPDAKRVVFEARGDIFTVPAEKGDVRNLTATPGVRERSPVWSPDGKWIAYLSDRSDEYEIYLEPADGKGEARQLTKGAKYYRFDLKWSPDSRRILCNDANLALSMVDVESGKITQIDRSEIDEIRDFSWSPDNRWVAYARLEPNLFSSIFLYDAENGEISRVTTDFTDDGNPVFDPKSRYLYFTSARHFNPTIGGYDLKPFWTHQDGLYLVTLKADVPNPFAPESDEVQIKQDDGGNAKGDDGKGAKGEKDEVQADTADKKDKDAATKTEIDLAGLTDRIVPIDLRGGNYGDLAATEDMLFYMSRPTRPGAGRGNRQGGNGILQVYKLEDREEGTVLDGVDAYGLSADGKKILYASQDRYGIVDAAPDQKPAEKPLRTGEMQAKIDPRAEWRQIFREAWRLERDFFYDPGLHGVDWKRMYERYGQLVPYVAHRSDLNYLIGEMIGELNCSHSYVGGGDVPEVKNVGVGLLGCDFTLEDKTGRYRLHNILRERDWNDDQRTPLEGPAIRVDEDDYLLAVDGVELRAPINPYALLEGKVDKQVILKVGPSADDAESREVTVKPIASEDGLRYVAWTNGNRTKVEQMSKGKIGYLHLPNTSIAGTQEFAKAYYPQVRKDGLIIDERYNGGGMIPDFFMNILRQKLVNMWKPRYGASWRTPGTAFLGHLAMISNGYAGSGGDCLPYYFKAYELGPVIGMRTWGGLVGISRGIRLLDGGRVTFPEFAFYNLEGDWDVENYGVDPDIVIDNLPQEVIKGRDPQLEKAVEVLLQRIQEDPVAAPQPGAFPRDKLK
jgi:tricorn protease